LKAQTRGRGVGADVVTGVKAPTFRWAILSTRLGGREELGNNLEEEATEIYGY